MSDELAGIVVRGLHARIARRNREPGPLAALFLAGWRLGSGYVPRTSGPDVKYWSAERGGVCVRALSPEALARKADGG